jgi:hypothetical protein
VSRLRLFATLVCAAITASPVFASPVLTGLDKIQMYAGSWKSEVAHFDTLFSKAGRDTAIIRNDCWRSGTYYVCNQYIDGDSKALLVYTYDSKDGTYSIYPIVANGGAVQPGKLIIRGNVWTFPWEEKEKDKTIYFHVINVFTSVDAIEYREEYSTDNEHWYPMAQGYEKKLPRQ